MNTKFTSVFSLRETGGAFNYPAKVIDNPEGGFIAFPFFNDHVKNLIAPGQIAEGGGHGLSDPSLVRAGTTFGNDFFSIFNLAKVVSQSKEKGAKGGGGKPVKPKAPKRPSKPAHKKLHANPHPILAECEKLMGRLFSHQSECDSSSMTPLVTVPGQGKKKESKLRIMTSNFRESIKSGPGLPTKFRVVLIQEGMGNSNDAYYYTREALESGVEVFSGLKIMVDHPSEEEERIRPERSTRDVIGHYENLSVENDPEGGQAMLCADLSLLDASDTELARAQMVRAVENSAKFPGRDFIGLSINASGPSAETPIEDIMGVAPEGAKAKLIEAQQEGISILRVVSKINRAVSCDLVTEAGAGGKILQIIGGADGKKAG